MNYRHSEVLNWVNEERKKKGLKPLKRLPYATRDASGTVVSPRVNNCPIAKAIQGICYSTEYRVSDIYPYNMPLPNVVMEWVGKFDAIETRKQVHG